VWRKVLLSKQSSSRSIFPALAVPSEEAIEEVTEGLFASFFGPGFDMQVVTDSNTGPLLSKSASVAAAAPPLTPAPSWSAIASTTLMPAWVPGVTTTVSLPQASGTATAYPQTTLDVDLHTCIAGNMPLLKSAWTPVWQLLEDATAQSSKAPAMGDIMMSMMDVQLALTRCNIGPAQEAMIIDSMESGKDIHTKFTVPESSKTQGDSVSTQFSTALEEFQEGHYYAFGSQLGAALQDMVVIRFSQKYEVDDAGRLRKRILGASAVGHFGISTDRGSPGLAVAVFLFVASVLLAALLVARRRLVAAGPDVRHQAISSRDLEAVE